MIDLYVIVDDFTTRKASEHLGKKFSQVSFDARIQDTAAIFGDPDDMILGAIGTVS